MKDSIQFTSARAARTRYKAILREDWDSEFLIETTRFLQAQIFPKDDAGFWSAAGFVAGRNSADSKSFPAPEVASALSSMAPGFLPRMPLSLKPHPSRRHRLIADLAIRVAGWLMIPRAKGLNGDKGLVLDFASLLFQASLHVLPNALKENHLKQEYDLLLNFMWLHCEACWWTDLAHQQHLLSCLYGELGQKEEEEKSLRNSFMLTRSDEHEFVTKAQLVWNCLLDQEKQHEAKEFILQVIRFAPTEAIGELHDLLEATTAAPAAK